MIVCRGGQAVPPYLACPDLLYIQMIAGNAWCSSPTLQPHCDRHANGWTTKHQQTHAHTPLMTPMHAGSPWQEVPWLEQQQKQKWAWHGSGAARWPAGDSGLPASAAREGTELPAGCEPECAGPAWPPEMLGCCTSQQLSRRGSGMLRCCTDQQLIRAGCRQRSSLQRACALGVLSTAGHSKGGRMPSLLTWELFVRPDSGTRGAVMLHRAARMRDCMASSKANVAAGAACMADCSQGCQYLDVSAFRTQSLTHRHTAMNDACMPTNKSLEAVPTASWLGTHTTLLPLVPHTQAACMHPTIPHSLNGPG